MPTSQTDLLSLHAWVDWVKMKATKTIYFSLQIKNKIKTKKKKMESSNKITVNKSNRIILRNTEGRKTIYVYKIQCFLKL